MYQKDSGLRTWICLCFILYPFSALGMDFTVAQWKGHQVLEATGRIVSGDASKFAKALATLPASPHGVPIVLLDSPGGSVTEALLMSKHLNGKPAHMVIANGAKCASACASILFIAGKYRTMEAFGRFGQHSCSLNGIQNQACNDKISEHALNNGVSYGSVAAFVTYVPPKDILWFSRTEIDCWGISRYPFTLESGFEKSEPCFFEMLKKEKPPSQTAWRVDFLDSGYSAFLRPVSDDQRELQLNVWCDETKRGKLFLSMDIAGSAHVIESAIIRAELFAKPVVFKTTDFLVEQIDENYSRLVIMIPKPDLLKFLTKSDRVLFRLMTKQPFEPIEVRTLLKGSRKALIFAANHCVNQ